MILYRFTILTSQKLGFVAMIQSLFKPLFGFPGFFSRIQGFILRTTAIAFSMAMIGAVLSFGIIGYLLLLFSIINAVFKAPLLIILLAVLMVIFKLYRYYFYPISPIENLNDFDEYIDSGDYKQREIVQLIKHNKLNAAIEMIFDSKFSKDFFLRSEIPLNLLEDYLYAYCKDHTISPNDFFTTLMKHNTKMGFRHLKYELFIVTFISIADPESRFLSKFNSDIETIIQNTSLVGEYYRHEFFMWDDEYQIPPSGGFDKDWAVGYSSTLNKVGTDLTKLALKGYMPKLIGREDVKEKVIAVLRKKTKNNVMLLGDPGSGKTTFINALAREIATGTPIPELKYKRLVMLDIGSLTSGSQGDINTRVTKIIKEIIEAGNIILCIDEIHNLSALSGGANATSVFSILESYLSRGAFQFIGTTTKENYNKYIAPNGSFSKNFDPIEMREANKHETLSIMVNLVRSIERSDGIKVTYPAYYKTYDYSDRFVTQRVFPDKGVELINQVIAFQVQHGKRNTLLTGETVSEYVSQAYKVPVNALQESESQKLINLESILHQRVIGQDIAIKNIASALKRSRVGVRDENKPIASFLFAGPTGVGKTETAKALSEVYFGTEEYMIRIDMSEYVDSASVNRLIGTATSPGYLTSAVRDRPYTLLLLDEIEKADKSILNLFLQVLDDGRLTDGNGKTISFSNTIIIMTSNIGTREIINVINSGGDEEVLKTTAVNALKGHFPPEFLNRFTGLVPFNPLSQNDLAKITQLKLASLARKMEAKHIYITFADEVYTKIAKLGFSPEWGARPLNRVIEEKIETALADKIIRSDIRSGDRITFDNTWIPDNDFQI